MCQPPLYSDSWYPDYHNNRQDTRNDVRHEQVEMSVFLDNARNSYGMQASPSPYYAPPQEQVPFLGGPGYGPIAIPDQPRINLACELITPEQAGDILVPKGKCVNARKHINKVLYTVFLLALYFFISLVFLDVRTAKYHIASYDEHHDCIVLIGGNNTMQCSLKTMFYKVINEG